jgi:hypothetical protein
MVYDIRGENNPMKNPATRKKVSASRIGKSPWNKGKSGLQKA